jgi:AraC-like DNA-binding protein
MTLSIPEPDWQIVSPDVRLVWHQVSRYLKRFRILPHAGVTYQARLFHVRLHDIEISLIDYGGPISIEAGRLGGFSIVQIPLRGSYVCRLGSDQLQVPTGCAHLVLPNVPLVMDWSADCRLLVIRFNALVGLDALDPAAAARQFGAVVDLASAQAEPFAPTLDYVIREAIAGQFLATSADAVLSADRLLGLAVQNLFTRQEQLHNEGQLPDGLMRAMAYGRAHLGDRLTLDDLCNASGLGRSALSQMFKHQLGVSPMAWVASQRLDRIRAALMTNTDRQLSVTELASSWGIAHLGRFSGSYAKRFGETPRATRQRALAQSS